jgi:uncharacterized RDD family membrane protein YckC
MFTPADRPMPAPDERSMFVMSAVESVRWLIFNICVPLFPLWATQIVAAAYEDPPPLSSRLREGELFVFSSTVSAAALGTALFLRDVRSIGITLSICGLIVLLLLSGGLSFTTVLARSVGKQPRNARRFSAISIVCAVAASGLGYVVQAARHVG